MIFKLTTKGKLKDIYTMRKFALQLIGRGKSYDSVLKYLLKEDYYYDDEIGWPSLKLIQNDLGISHSVLKRNIDKIYKDLENINSNGIDYTIKNIEYYFFLEFLDLQAVVKLHNIPVCPRVGEQIDIPYFKEKIHAERFYVRSVDHEFTDSKQIIYIDLVVGNYNTYWNLKRDEEYAKGRMSYDDYRSKDESKIRKSYNLRWL